MDREPQETALPSSAQACSSEPTEKREPAGDTVCGLDERSLRQMHVVIASKIEAINPVVRKIMQLLSRTCCPPEHEFAIETALREALANAIVHGNKSDPKKKVRISCGCVESDGVHIAIQDEGEGFDSAVLADPLEDENIAADHGRGIFLIGRLMDEMHFNNGGREIHMRKHRILPR